MTSEALRGAVERLRPAEVGYGALVGASLRLLGASPPLVWALFAVLAAANAAEGVFDQRAGLSPPGAPLPPAELAGHLVASLVSAILTAFVLRLWLGARGPWRLDRGLAGYVLFDFSASAAYAAPDLIGQTALPLGLAEPGAFALDFAAFAAATWLYARLLPWPLAGLAGEGPIRPAEAWAMTRGAGWPFLLMIFLLSLAAELATGLLSGALAVGTGRLWLDPVVSGIGTTAMPALVAAGAAVVYQQRARVSEGVAATFD